MDGLAGLRTQIDAIDDQLIALLQERARYVRQVGELKESEGNQCSFLRPAREAVMVRRLVERVGDAYDASFVERVWRTIISASLMMEQSLRVCVLRDPSILCAVGHYFPGVPVDIVDGFDALEGMIATDTSVIGVLPAELEPEWVGAVVEGKGNIFAEVPFVQEGSGVMAYAYGIVQLEPTGNDITRVVQDGKVLELPGFLNDVEDAFILGWYAKAIGRD